MAADPRRQRPSLASREETDRFIAAFLGTVEELQGLLDEQTGHLAAGRMRDGLAREERKTELAGGYLRGLEHARANAVAIARFTPDRVGELRRRHELFRAAVERNQVVIATARAVSEGLVRGVAEEVARQSRPRHYGTGGSGAPARAIAYSARL